MYLWLKSILNWLIGFLSWRNRAREATMFLVRLQDETRYRWFFMPTGPIAARVSIKGETVTRLQIAESWKDNLDTILASADIMPGSIKIEWMQMIPDNFDWN